MDKELLIKALPWAYLLTFLPLYLIVHIHLRTIPKFKDDIRKENEREKAVRQWVEEMEDKDE